MVNSVKYLKQINYCFVFCVIIKVVIIMAKNEFDKDIKYRLYRTVKELLHPTISKKNISEYKIIIKDDLLPLYVYYPKKVSTMEKVLIYIHGDSKITECENSYPEICNKLAINTDSIVMAIDYPKMKKNFINIYTEIYNTVKHINSELNELNKNIKIVLAGDSTGCNIINGINYLNKKEINITKEIFFYPVLNTKKIMAPAEHELFNPNLLLDIENYFKSIADNNNLTSDILNYNGNMPNTLIVIGNIDPLKSVVEDYSKNNKNIQYTEIAFASHGFLKKADKEAEIDTYNAVNKFIKE